MHTMISTQVIYSRDAKVLDSGNIGYKELYRPKDIIYSTAMLILVCPVAGG